MCVCTAAGWLTEEEYNFELKKLLGSHGTQAAPAPPGTTNSAGSAAAFGCPHRHAMKVFKVRSRERERELERERERERERE